MDTEDVCVSAVRVKIPSFWEKDPEAWFGQAEAQFHLWKVKNSTTKFYRIISMLPTRLQYLLRISPESLSHQSLMIPLSTVWLSPKSWFLQMDLQLNSMVLRDYQ